MKKKSKTHRRYHLFDCRKFILGRMSAKIAFILQGKHKCDYTPNLDRGDFAVVINSDNLKVTGRKMDDKIYYSFSGYPGGITSANLKKLCEEDSRRVITSAVYGMLPKNKLRDKMMKRLLVFRDKEHNLKVKIEEVKP